MMNSFTAWEKDIQYAINYRKKNGLSSMDLDDLYRRTVSVKEDPSFSTLLIEEFYPKLFYDTSFDKIQLSRKNCHQLCYEKFTFPQNKVYDDGKTIFENVRSGVPFKMIRNQIRLLRQSNGNTIYKYYAPFDELLIANISTNKLLLHSAESGILLTSFIDYNTFNLECEFYSSSRGPIWEIYKYETDYTIEFCS